MDYEVSRGEDRMTHKTRPAAFSHRLVHQKNPLESSIKMIRGSRSTGSV
jgi:hypothetical protein